MRVRGGTVQTDELYGSSHIIFHAGRRARLGSHLVDRGRSLLRHCGLDYGGPPSPELIFDCALGPPAAFFLCFLPVRPRPLAFLGIGTCHRAVCGDEQAGPGHGHRSTMWPCLWHITCVVVCRHTRQMVPPARILQHFSPHAPQSDCRFGEGPKSGPTPGPTC